MTGRKASRLLAGMTVLLSGCKPGGIGSSRVYFDPIRYRLTAKVETPSGVKTGSSVIQTIWDRGLSGATVTGEAVAIDLPANRSLFVLLRTKSKPDWAGEVPGISAPQDAIPPTTSTAREAEAERQVGWIRANREVHYLWGGDVPKERAEYLPYIIWFKNIADPKSVELVNPVDLAQTFGPGYRLKSLTVQVTDDAITKGIEKRLAWLKLFPEPRLIPIPIGGAKNPTIGQIISHGDLRRDDTK